MSIRLSAMALVAAAFVPMSAQAADDRELQGIRAQLDQLKATYEGRIQALEARLQALQQRLESKAAPEAAPAGTGEAAAPPGRSATAAPLPSEPSSGSVAGTGVVAEPLSPTRAGGTQSASAFNPAISLILNGSYANLSRDPSLYRLQGFIPSGGEVGPGVRSFSLGESELTLSASIDPTFSGRLTAATRPRTASRSRRR